MTAPTTKTLQQQIVDYLDGCANAFPLPGRKKNMDSVLGRLYFWQVASKHAAQREKDTWATLQGDGDILSDDDMRNKGAGRHIIDETDNFTVLAEVKKPAERLDVKLLAQKMAKRFKITEAAANALIVSCRVPGDKASLSRSILCGPEQ